MENGPLVVSANFCNPFDDRALSKNAFPLFRLCPTASHIHPDFPLLFHLMDTSAYIGTYPLELPTTGLLARDSLQLSPYSGSTLINANSSLLLQHLLVGNLDIGDEVQQENFGD